MKRISHLAGLALAAACLAPAWAAGPDHAYVGVDLASVSNPQATERRLGYSAYGGQAWGAFDGPTVGYELGLRSLVPSDANRQGLNRAAGWQASVVLQLPVVRDVLVFGRFGVDSINSVQPRARDAQGNAQLPFEKSDFDGSRPSSSLWGAGLKLVLSRNLLLKLEFQKPDPGVKVFAAGLEVHL